MGDFDYKIWLKKLLLGLGATVVATGVIYVSQYIVEYPLPPEYAFWGGLMVTAFNMLGNFIKHEYLNE